MELSHSNKRATKIIWNIPSSPSKTPSPRPQHTHLSLCLAPLGLDFEKVDQWKVISCYYGRVLTTGGLQDLGKQMPSGIWNRNHASYISYCLTPFYSFFFFGLFFFFGTWDLSSATRDRTYPPQWKCTTGLPGKSYP